MGLGASLHRDEPHGRLYVAGGMRLRLPLPLVLLMPTMRIMMMLR